MVEPINKKRKLQANGSLDKQPSFTDVLQQLDAEDDGIESESTYAIGPCNSSIGCPWDGC